MSRNTAQSDRGEPEISEEPLVIRPKKRRPSPGYLLEQWTPSAIGMAAGLAGWNFGYLHLLSAQWGGAFLERVITIVAIIIGYLIAVIAILPAVEEKTIIRKLKDWDYFKILVGYFGSAIWSAFILLGLSILPATLPYRTKLNRTADGMFSAVWWFAFAFVAAAVIRATRLLLKLLTAR